MAVEETTSLNISCDNPDCPGTDLNPEERSGWLFVSSEFYGEPVQQSVFCSPSCVSAATTNKDASFLSREEASVA